MSGKRHRKKGDRVERELVRLHEEHDIQAERVPLSGAAGGSFAGDLIIAGKYRAEVKARKSGGGFAMIERWLGGHNLLFLRRDRRSPLVVMDFDMYTKLMCAASGKFR